MLFIEKFPGLRPGDQLICVKEDPYTHFFPLNTVFPVELYDGRYGVWIAYGGERDFRCVIPTGAKFELYASDHRWCDEVPTYESADIQYIGPDITFATIFDPNLGLEYKVRFIDGVVDRDSKPEIYFV